MEQEIQTKMNTRKKWGGTKGSGGIRAAHIRKVEFKTVRFGQEHELFRKLLAEKGAHKHEEGANCDGCTHKVTVSHPIKG